MVSALLFLSVIQFVANLVFLYLMACRRTPLFRPVERGTAHHVDRQIFGLNGRKRTGPVCFVTGMSRTACTCAQCKEGR